MFVRNDVLVDARVLKEAGSLRDAGHDVTIVGITRPGTVHATEREPRDGFEIVRVPLPRWRRWWRWLRAPSRAWSILRRRSNAPGSRMDGLDWLAMWRFGTLGWAKAAATVAGPADVYHGHDLTGLPAAIFARRLHNPAARVVYDSHELYIDSGATVGRPRWAVSWLDRREREWAAEADALVTVSWGYAGHLGPRLGIKRLVVVHNCPPRALADIPRSGLIRDAAGIPDDGPIVLYHGGLRAGRGVRELALAMLEPGLEQAHLVFLGFGPLQAEVEALASDPRFGRRIHFLPPVPPLEVVRWVASVDIAGMAIQPHNYSYELSTPNKLFEALAAGVPVAGSDFSGFRSIVADNPEGPLGELFDPTSPASIAAAIRRILELAPDAHAALVARCKAAARERWNWETEVARLVDLYRDLEA
ncbi:MAG TPA: glycosyltransferase [Candidatus Limnocylindrales bacterium]